MKLKNVLNYPKRAVNYFRHLWLSIKGYFYLKYLAVYELVTLSLLARATKMVRQLIVYKGKDPDYVAPPPPPPVVQEVVKPRPTLNIPYVPSWTRASFKSLAKHPIYQSRINLNLQPNKFPAVPVVEPLQVVLAPTPPLETPQEPTVPEIVDLSCDQCEHPDHDGLHTCKKFNLPEQDPALVAEAELLATDSKTFIKFGSES